MSPLLHALTLPLSWIAPFLVVMMTIVIVHEFGHFFAARCFGVAIDRFSIGFGRALVSWRDRSGVEWRIGWAPFGGYVQFAGDENVASVPDQNDLEQMRADIVAREGPRGADNYLVFKPLWQRAVVAAAGPFANFVLSSVIFAALAMIVGEPVARVDGVEPGSPAAIAGLKPGDIIKGVAGHGVGSFADLEQVVAYRANVPLTINIRRADRDMMLTATPAAVKVKDILGRDEVVGQLGVLNMPSRAGGGWYRPNPLEAIGLGVARTVRMVDTTFYYLGRAIHGQMSFDQLGGPLRTAQLSHAIATAGVRAGDTLAQRAFGLAYNLATIVAMLSVGVGIFNLAPIPVLDGGHLAFYAYEAVARRPLNAAVQAVSYRVGLALLLGLMLFATTNDLRHSSVFHFLGLFS